MDPTRVFTHMKLIHSRHQTVWEALTLPPSQTLKCGLSSTCSLASLAFPPRLVSLSAPLFRLPTENPMEVMACDAGQLVHRSMWGLAVNSAHGGKSENMSLGLLKLLLLKKRKTDMAKLFSTCSLQQIQHTTRHNTSADIPYFPSTPPPVQKE